MAAIRPIFALEPRLHISPAVPGEVSFRDLAALYRGHGSRRPGTRPALAPARADIDPQALSAPLAHPTAIELGAATGTKTVSSRADEG